MSPQAKHSEEPDALPPAELNPLLNPLLERNMTRWAHVYFGNPPEKRDRAVQELLHQLEAESAPPAPTLQRPTLVDNPSEAAEQQTEQAPRSQTLAPDTAVEEPPPVVCETCGRENLPAQRFCGRCGSRLAVGGAFAELPHEPAHEYNQGLRGTQAEMAGQHREDAPLAESEPLMHNQEIRAVPENRERYHVARERDLYEPRSSGNELSLFQNSRNVPYDENQEQDQIFSVPRSPGSYRIYIGLVLVIILGALGYEAWRSSQAPSQSALAPPVATKPPESEPVPPSPATKTATPERASTSDKQPAAPAHHAAEPTRRELARSEAHVAKNTTAPTEHKAPPKTPGAETSTSGGAEELAVAQRYLSGTNGQSRNSAEAAQWLWKAMAKHNAEAPLLLSDLYLRGDGVSKSCDQARVLLDAAALKGLKEAGQRLRHLSAFGCQ